MQRDELSFKYGRYLYFVTYEDFFKVGIANVPKKRMEAIIKVFGLESLNFNNSFYVDVPESFAIVLESAIKKKFPNYDQLEKYKTECFPIEYLEAVKDFITNFFENLELEFEFHYMLRDFYISKNETNEVVTIRSAKTLYTFYNLYKNNESLFDEMFSEKLAEDEVTHILIDE